MRINERKYHGQLFKSRISFCFRQKTDSLMKEMIVHKKSTNKSKMKSDKTLNWQLNDNVTTDLPI